MREQKTSYPTRGFGSPNYDKAKARKIASLGGKRAHALGVAHKWTSATAAIAGRKGGSVTQRNRRAVA